MHNMLQELLAQYKSETNHDFQSIRYPDPKVTPPKLVKLVASIKVVSAEARQLDIMSEIRKGEKAGDAFIDSDENVLLTTEFENLKNEVALWQPYV